jgi:deoxyribose-phosphate aldolase
MESALARLIDHTLLRPDATEAQIATLCEEAKTHGFFSVCVEKRWVPRALEHLRGTGVKVITVVAFPTGVGTPESKASETGEAVRLGAEEIDMVIDKDAVRRRDFATTYREIAAVVAAAAGRPVKVILETAELSPEDVVASSAVARAAGAAFVKTSTGFGAGGASLEAVRAMRRTVGPDFGVKASGGIRSTAEAVAMVEAGANRLGTSASVAIVQGSHRGADRGGY